MDTSAYVKLPLGEPEAPSLRRHLEGYEGFVSSAIMRVEAVRACARYGADYASAARAGLEGIALLPVTDDLLETASELAPAALRSLDAIHLATALSLGPDLAVLVAYDARLLDAARGAGVAVVTPASRA